MTPIGFKYPEWIDNDADKLQLKNDAPDKVKKDFAKWLKDIHSPFAKHVNEVGGFKIDDLL